MSVNESIKLSHTQHRKTLKSDATFQRSKYNTLPNNPIDDRNDARLDMDKHFERRMLCRGEEGAICRFHVFEIVV